MLRFAQHDRLSKKYDFEKALTPNNGHRVTETQSIHLLCVSVADQSAQNPGAYPVIRRPLTASERRCYPGPACGHGGFVRRLDYSWAILATGFIVLFFSGGSRFAMGLMLKPMSDDLGWSRSSLSLAVTCFMVTSALALPVVGRLADRYDLRWIMGTGAALAALGIGLMGWVFAPWQLFMVYGVVFAIGNAGTSNPTVGVMISRWFPRRRGIANSAAVSGNALGQLVIIGLLVAVLLQVGWRISFIVLGVINLAIVAPLVLAAIRSGPPGLGEQNGPLGATARGQAAATPFLWPESLLGSRPLWLLGAVYAACGFQDFFVATHVVAFALDRGIGSVLAGNLLALMGLTGLVGVLASGVLADSYGPRRPTALCFLMRIGIFALIIYSQGRAAIVLFALLYGFTFLIAAPLSVVFAGNIFGPARLGTVSGTISMVHQIAGGLGALAGAVIFDHWGSYDRAFGLMLGLAVFATAATLVVRDRQPSKTLPF